MRVLVRVAGSDLAETVLHSHYMDAARQQVRMFVRIARAQCGHARRDLEAWVVHHRQASAQRGAELEIRGLRNESKHLQLALGDRRAVVQLWVKRLEIGPAGNIDRICAVATHTAPHVRVLDAVDGVPPTELDTVALVQPARQGAQGDTRVENHFVLAPQRAAQTFAHDRRRTRECRVGV